MNQLAEEVKKAEGAKPPSDADLRAELERERQARAAAEQQANYFRGAAAAEWDRNRQAARPPADPLTDPFAKLAAEDPLLPADQRARLLDEGARSRAREEVQRALNEERARMQMAENQRRGNDALEMFQSAHPEVVADREKFTAATVVAKMRADEKGLNLSPIQLLNYGLQVYNEGKAPAADAPYTEGASGASGRGVMPPKEEPPPLSMAERYYGATDFIDEDKVPIDAYTETYLDKRNLELVEKEKFWSKLRPVENAIREATRRAKTAAGR